MSSAAILIRVAAAPALAIAFWRTFGGTIALAPFAAPRLRAARPTDRVVRSLAWSGLALAVHFALFIGSLSYTTVASSVTLATMSPLFVGLGATWFLREPPSRRMWTGMAVTVVGAITIGVGDASGLELGGRALLGDAMALASAVAVTAYLLIGRALRPQVPIAVYGTVVYGVAAVALLIATLLSQAALTGYDSATWLALLGLVVGPQLLGHTVFNTLLSRVTATVIAIVVLAEPVGATVLAMILLDESPAPLFWVGAPLILAGVAIATLSARRRPAPAPL
ncbi:MAG: DMT family transporter [Actinobacteria bacterium]|nr:DMT family transporter [Actinomycetota bacterium]